MGGNNEDADFEGDEREVSSCEDLQEGTKGDRRVGSSKGCKDNMTFAYIQPKYYFE